MLVFWPPFVETYSISNRTGYFPLLYTVYGISASWYAWTLPNSKTRVLDGSSIPASIQKASAETDSSHARGQPSFLNLKYKQCLLRKSCWGIGRRCSLCMILTSDPFEIPSASAHLKVRRHCAVEGLRGASYTMLSGWLENASKVPPCSGSNEKHFAGAS